jgi:hypothetical protein
MNSSGAAQERKIGILWEILFESFRERPSLSRMSKLLSSSGPSNKELKTQKRKDKNRKIVVNVFNSFRNIYDY